MDISTLTRSVTDEGVRYLELFLKEFTTLFPGPVNPSCPTCLHAYLTAYKQHYNTMQNTCTYRLHAKYENIPLEFGSPILVNNTNITTAYAKQLLQQPNGQRFFAQLPPKEEPLSEKIKTLKKVVRKSAKAKKKDPENVSPPDISNTTPA
ncbi:hypothetical protein Q766_16055 [Flavobacterium subsaxonicum WB 4.1-42 = DSM 21790]|uniref:Uncharacterized protein n=2 Tax=Flavobacterium TaxID=237 RepID=A0A0A2MHK2_9FLAO|nr:hypothetical protein Q766_16055 [Flavobacterium subsaxonicum WB 4.1-42 = DSM 21790]